MIILNIPFEKFDGQRVNDYTRGYKTFFMLNSAEQEIQLLVKTKMLQIKDFSFFRTLKCYIYPANKC